MSQYSAQPDGKLSENHPIKKGCGVYTKMRIHQRQREKEGKREKEKERDRTEVKSQCVNTTCSPTTC